MRRQLQLLIALLLALPIGMLAQGTTWQTATEIARGGSGSGSLSNDNGEAWFKIVVPENGEAVFTVAKTDGDLGMGYVKLYDLSPDGNTHGRGEIWNVGEFKVKDCAKGTYYLMVPRNSGKGSFKVTYTFNPTSANYKDDTEPNDKWQQGVQLTSGVSNTGHLGYYYYEGRDEEDWYKIVVPENGTVKVTIAAHGELNLSYTTLYVIDANGSDHNRGSVWGGNDDKAGEFTVPACAPGTYYLRVPRNGGQGGYTLRYDFTATSSVYSDDNEPNQTYETAKEIFSGVDVTGHMGYYYWDDMDEVDWFKFEVPENGTVKVTITPHDALNLSYTTLYVIDAKGADHNRGSVWNGGEFTVPACAPGTYYLRVPRNGGQGGYTLRYDFTATSSVYSDDNEPNQTYETAKQIYSGVDVTGHMGYYYWDDMDEVDWFKFEVPENGSVKVTITPHDDLGLSYTTLFVIDAKGADHNRGSVWNGGEFTVPACAPGTYYIRVPRNGGQGGYTLRYDFTATSSAYPDDNEPNQTYETAKLIKSGVDVTGHMGYYYWDDMDEVDWFKVEVPENGKVKVTITAHGDLGLSYTTLYVFDANGADHNRGSVWGGNDEVPGEFTVKDCAKGTYYIRVPRNGGQGGYTLNYVFTATSDDYYDDFEPNDTWEQAHLLKRGNTLTGHLGYTYWDNRDTEDWYKIEVPRDGKITLTVKAHDGLGLSYTNIYAKDANNEMHSRGSVWGGSDENPGVITVSNAAPGTYYIRVPQNNGQGAYSLEYAFEQNLYATDKEPNDDMALALPLAEGATVAGHLGYLYYNDTDKVDWYKLTLPSKGDITLTYQVMKGLGLAYVTLYDSGEHSKGSLWGQDAEGNNTFTVKNLEAGTYYVRVAHNGGEGYYLLTYGATLGSVDQQEPLANEPQEDQSSTKPDTPDTPDDPDPQGETVDEFTLWYMLDIGGTVGYKLSEKPQVRLLGEETTVTSSRGVATFLTKDIWKFTLSVGSSDPVGIEETFAPVQTEAQPSISRESDALVFSGCRPGEPVVVYTTGGRLVSQYRIGDDGSLTLSLSSLGQGLYIVKAGSANIKIMKK